MKSYFEGEIRIESTKIELNFLKEYRTVLNQLIESYEVSDSSKENITRFTREIKELLKKVKEWLKYLVGNEKDIYKEYPIKEMIKVVKFSLAESIFERQSAFIRFFLKTVFSIEIKCGDLEVVNAFIPFDEIKKIFSNDYIPPDRVTLNDILSLPLTLKSYGKIFTSYETPYPFELDTVKKEIEYVIEYIPFQGGISSGNLLLYENYFFLFSNYLPFYYDTIFTLMNEQGLIPITWRYFIAIMAVSTIRSHYLLKHLQQTFLMKGGDEKWLICGHDKEVIPEKLIKLGRLNNILAHQPWKLNTKELNELLKFNVWTRDELVHAALIIINFHRIASIAESLKIGNEEKNTKSMSSALISENEGKKQLIKNLIQMNTDDDSSKEENKLIEDDEDERNFLMEKYFDGKQEEFTHYISDFCTLYLDFDTFSDPFLSNVYFNWDNEGYYILETMYRNGVILMNKEINFITDLSSNRIGGDFEKLDTFHFRYAVRCYIEKIYGITNEDYDYSKTNKLLKRPIKQFIKNVTCLPQKIQFEDIQVLRNTFSIEELVHLVILASVNKARIELTYFSYSLYNIIKSID